MLAPTHQIRISSWKALKYRYRVFSLSSHMETKSIPSLKNVQGNYFVLRGNSSRIFRQNKRLVHSIITDFWQKKNLFRFFSWRKRFRTFFRSIITDFGQKKLFSVTELTRKLLSPVLNELFAENRLFSFRNSFLKRKPVRILVCPFNFALPWVHKIHQATFKKANKVWDHS